jgi:hypothetical protein
MGIINAISSVFVKLAFRFEILFPQVFKFFVNRKLKEYKTKGVITDYKTKAGRWGKGHYFLEMDLFLKDLKGGEILG